MPWNCQLQVQNSAGKCLAPVQKYSAEVPVLPESVPRA